MIYAVFSDVHANAAALERVLTDARAAGAERLLCLGDVVGYGPSPSEAVEMLRASGATVLAGNHDDAVTGRIGAEDFIDLAGEAVRRHRAALSSAQLAYLRALPHLATFGSVRAAHGDFTDPKAFNYVDSEAAAEANFKAVAFQIGFVGHTHEPCLYLTGKSGAVYRLSSQDFYLEEGKRYIVNPGSVGYPRASNGECFSSYLLYDTKERLVRFRFLPFAVSSVMQRGSPTRAGRRTLLLAAGLGLAAVSVAGFLSMGRLRSSGAGAAAPATDRERTAAGPPRVAEATPEADLLDRRVVDIPLGHAFLRANLRLEKGSGGVQLRIAYLTSSDQRLGEEAVVVKSGSKQRFRIPAGTARAELCLTRLGSSPMPKVVEFQPVTEPLRRKKTGRRTE